MEIELQKSWKCFNGEQYVFRHFSDATKTNMDFAVFVPQHTKGETLGGIVFLSGLTCTWENFTTKAGAQLHAAQHRQILIMPDTSPRGDAVPDDDAYYMGQGAGFYVDATQSPWDKNFQMYSYINNELMNAVSKVAPVDRSKLGICGHSMGGHGALVSALRNPEKYKSVSAIAPIVAPSKVPWGKKAFSNYLGSNTEQWSAYDSCELISKYGWNGTILIDQGGKDEFLQEQLKPELFAKACEAKGVDLKLRLQDGYDHSYYFIASVIGDHIKFHAEI